MTTVDDERYQQALRNRAKTQRDAAKEAFREAGDNISRHVGVTVATDRLEIEELQELRSLISRVTHVDELEVARAGGLQLRGWNLALLDRRQLRKFESLVEKGADMKGMFKARRDQAKLAAAMQEAGEIVRRESRPRRPKLEEPGVVQLPAFLFEDGWLGGSNDFGVADLGILALILGAIENRVEWIPGSHVEGDTLVAQMEVGGIGGYLVDPDQILMPRRKQFLDYLAENKLLTIEKRASTWRISRGPVLLAEEQHAVAKAERGNERSKR